jgi:hypothetical protein
MAMRDDLDRIRETNQLILRDKEAAEARVADVSPVIQQLIESHTVPEGHGVFGDVVATRGHEDGVTCFRAAIQIPGGVGVLQYEDDDYNTDPYYHFIPFEGCLPNLQGKLGSQIPVLVAKLHRSMN